jgi:hypothetical protein
MNRLSCIFLVFGLVGCIDQKPLAESQAREFLRTGYTNQWRNVQCMNVDTDRNGYVSCTVFMNNGQTLSIECARQDWLTVIQNNGCRLQPRMMNNMVTQ